MKATLKFSFILAVLASGPMAAVQASPYNAAVLSSGPAFYWTFDEASGNAIDQVAGLAADDLVPGATAVRGASTSTAGGVSLGTAAQFTGLSQHEFQANDLTGDGGTLYWAVEFWAKSDTTNTYSYLMGGSNLGNLPAFLQWGNASNPSAVQYYANGGGVQTTATAPAASTSWQHFVFVVDVFNNTATAYVNGALWGSQGLGSLTDPLPYGKWTVGSHALGALTERFSGSIDEVAIYDLTSAPDLSAKGLEIAQHYNVADSVLHPGDFDGDGDVDGADFVAWQTNFPKPTGTTLAEGDADGDGDVDGADFVVWQTNFPFTPGPGASPVPEPASLSLVAALGICLIAARRWSRG